MRPAFKHVALFLALFADSVCSAQRLDRTEVWRGRLLTLIQQADPAPPGAPNGWCDLLECSEIIKRVEGDLFDADFDSGFYAFSSDWPYEEPEPGEPPLGNIERVLVQLCGLLDGHGLTAALRRAEAAGRWIPVPAVSESGLGVAFTADLSFFYPIARISRGRIAHSASRGEWSDVSEWVGFALMSAYASERGGGLICGAMGAAGRSMVWAAIRGFKQVDPPPAGVLKAMLESFDRYENMPPLERLLRLDELELQHAIDSLHSPDGVMQVARVADALYMAEGVAQLVTDWDDEFGEEELKVRWPDMVRQGLTSEWINLFGFLAPRRDQTERYVGEFVNAVIAGLKPGASVREHAIQFLDDHDDRYASANALLRIYPRAWERLFRQRDEITAIQNGTRLLLAIELHRATTGSLPDSLDALVPDTLPEPLADPFAPDGLFRYRRLDGDGKADPRGATYLLYSVGLDGIDNSGTAPLSGRMHEANMPQGAGSDHVFEWVEAVD